MPGPRPRSEAVPPLGMLSHQCAHPIRERNEFASAQRLVLMQPETPKLPPLEPKSGPQRKGTTGRPRSCWPP